MEPPEDNPPVTTTGGGRAVVHFGSRRRPRCGTCCVGALGAHGLNAFGCKGLDQSKTLIAKYDRIAGGTTAVVQPLLQAMFVCLCAFVCVSAVAKDGGALVKNHGKKELRISPQGKNTVAI
jgi:hypothetical protein